MDLLTLEIFCAVAAEGSITRAAERLGRVQSNVTTRIQQLEESLGSALFLRESRRVLLTPAGETLLGYAHRLLALAEETRQAVHPDQPTGRLRLGSMESTAAARLPLILAELHTRWPALRLELSTDASRELTEKVLSHQLDVALVAWPPPDLPADLPLDLTPVFNEALCLAIPQGIDIGNPKTLPSTLAAFDAGCTYRRLGEQALEQALGQRPKLLELGSYHAILACVAAGHCAGVVPLSVLALMREPPPILQLPLGHCTTMLISRRGYRSAAFDVLRDALLANAAASSQSLTPVLP